MKITFLIPPANAQGKAPDRIFGCLAEGTMVFGNPSTKLIENVEVGSRVLTHDGTYKDVLFTNSREVDEEVVKLRVKHGSTKTITKDHPVLVYSANGLRWVPSHELKSGDKLVFPIDRETIDKEYITVDVDKSHEVKELGLKTSNISEISRKVGVSRVFARKCLNSDKVGYNTDAKIPYMIPVNNDLMLFLGYYLAEGSVNLRPNRGRGDNIFV